jgi:hypothetical protein
VVWCLSDKWCYNSFTTAYPKLQKDLDRYREVHEKKDLNADITAEKNRLFDKLFMNDRYNYVYPVNPFHFHERPNVQQSVFLCPGRISTPAVKILMSLKKKTKDTPIDYPILKLSWRINNETEWLDALDELHRSNISRVSLFPGIDGFAYSLNFRLRHYDQLANYRTRRSYGF